MRDVAVTEGDKVEAELRFGVSVNTYGVNDLVALVDAVPDPDVDALVADLGIEPEELAEVALRFVLARPEVSTVIAGMRTVANVERNAAVGDGRRLDDRTLEVLARHRWERNFYQPA